VSLPRSVKRGSHACKWKKRVFASPSARNVILEHCHIMDHEGEARPNHFNFNSRCSTILGSDKARRSWVRSSWRITSCAIANSRLRLPTCFWLHENYDLTVLLILQSRNQNGSNVNLGVPTLLNCL
jgi:hypothetical protein